MLKELIKDKFDVFKRYGRKFKQKIVFQKQKKCRGWSDEETWNLNNELIKWINERLTRYLEVADNVIDLDYYKYEYGGKIYTQKEIIRFIIDETNNYLVLYELNCYIKNREKHIIIIFDLLKLIFEELWW